tara:strand:+ start:5085 stop:6335 length:1251 start_codon:yes stop_codon:yes gene_type:complete
MNKKLQPVRGTHDHLQDQMQIYDHIISVSKNVCIRYGFHPFSTPIFEFSEVFKKTLGNSSDIVTKEMYTFKDKGNEEITLRPEGTAGIIRAIISNGLTHEMPFKVFYNGPMFRYERPQKGRLRQFHQIGIEIIGVQNEIADTEVIACGHRLLKELKIDNKVSLEINSLGKIEDRKKYIKDLLNYLKSYKNKLSADSLKRFEKNPLRILDSKNEEDINIISNAPKILEYLNDESKSNFQNILNNLKSLNISYNINPKLVRGLDYYNNIAFEFISQELGAQGAVIAGGRYDGLMMQMGGPDLPGIGWAAGLERISLLTKTNKNNIKSITIIPLGYKSQKFCIKIAEQLRKEKIKTNITYSGNLKKRLQSANKLLSDFALIIGEKELEKNIVIIKDLNKGKQTSIKIENTIDYLKKLLN